MTDNEIIKALECCMDCKCKECPCYNKETDGCTEIDEEEILDLINRQRAEIERLQKQNKYSSANNKGLRISLNTAKFEAYKEFAENWHNKLNEAKKAMVKNAIADSVLDIASCITDTVAKEMGAEHKETVSMIDGHIEE